MVTNHKAENEENDAGLMGTIIAILLLICIFLILSPGVLITSILRLMIDFTTGQLWGCTIIFSIACGVYMHFLTKQGFSFTRYLIFAGICAAFIFILTLFVNDNCFFNTVKLMFEESK